ncbi:MAG: relaxase/mobilization nuclease domain-containing protein, partial [Sneathiellales bacterium]|nr:relaxase/mobilization nuclease domain-containing protein [Sneathiellales bacterium]
MSIGVAPRQFIKSMAEQAMIPFASQRANGQDLVAHLLNEQDNDYLRIVSMEGCIAEDLHGAFAEWELQAKTLTNAKNYLYSLSTNPKDPLDEEQMLDYIDRVEQAIGLVGQSLTIVEHIKSDRMHWHAAWSRIDAENEKAIPISFDRQKLMMTRDYARDHQIDLPEGYYKKFERTQEKDKDYNLGEKYQFETTGLSKEERT